MNELLLFVVVVSMGVLVQSFAGFGGGLVSMPLLTAFVPAQRVVPAYNLVLLVLLATLVFESRQHVRLRQVAFLIAGGVCTVPLGSYLLKITSPETIALVVSSATLLFATLMAFRVRLPLPASRPCEVGVGMVSGLLGGSIVQSGPPVVLYGLTRGWAKDSFRTSMLSYFVVLSCVAAVSHAVNRLTTWQSALWAGASLPFSLLVAHFGVRLKNRASEASYRRIVLVIILGVGVFGLAKTLWTWRFAS